MEPWGLWLSLHWDFIKATGSSLRLDSGIPIQNGAHEMVSPIANETFLELLETSA